MNRIDTIADLEALYAQVVPAAQTKVAQRLTPTYRAWIEAAYFCILSTVGPAGVHGSPRGDRDPVVRIQDDQTILMPDWRGNNRLDCLRDIVEDGRCALLFLSTGNTTTLRVNGRAMLTDDLALRETFAKGETLPATVIVLTIAEVYPQCAKALMRSELWTRAPTPGLPTVGDMIAEMSKGTMGGPEYDAGYADYAKPRMW